MSAPPGHVVEVCRARAAASPCGKSQRGSVVFDPANGAIYGHACNHLPGGLECAEARRRQLGLDGATAPDVTRLAIVDADARRCREACGLRCVHAEAAAILRTATTARADLEGLEIVHVKTIDGVAVASGGPSCVPCAALILEVGLAACWLLHADGWTRYPAAEFYRLSCAARGVRQG